MPKRTLLTENTARITTDIIVKIEAINIALAVTALMPIEARLGPISA